MHIYNRIRLVYRRQTQALEDFIEDDENFVPWRNMVQKLLQITQWLTNCFIRILLESVLWELLAPVLVLLLLPIIKPFISLTLLQQIFIITLTQFVTVLQLATCSFHLTSSQSGMDYFPGFFVQLSIPYGNRHLMHNRLLRGDFRAICAHFFHILSASYLTNILLPSFFSSPAIAGIIAAVLYCCFIFYLHWTTVTRIFCSLHPKGSSTLSQRVFIDRERAKHLKESRRPSYYHRDIIKIIFFLFCVVGTLLIYYLYLGLVGQCFGSVNRSQSFCFDIFSQFFSLIFHFCAEAVLALEIIIDQLALKERFVAYHYFKGSSKDRWHILVCLRSNENGIFLKDLSYVVFAMKGAQWKERIKRYVKNDEQSYRFTDWGDLPTWILTAIERDDTISSSSDIPEMAC